MLGRMLVNPFFNIPLLTTLGLAPFWRIAYDTDKATLLVLGSHPPTIDHTAFAAGVLVVNEENSLFIGLAGLSFSSVSPLIKPRTRSKRRPSRFSFPFFAGLYRRQATRHATRWTNRELTSANMGPSAFSSSQIPAYWTLCAAQSLWVCYPSFFFFQ